MSHTNATNFRIRVINPYFYGNWQDVNDYNTAADEIIKTPEKYLLSNSALFEAEGGYGGLGLQLAVMALGVGSVFASSARMGMYWKSGSLKWMEWLCLGGTAVGAHAIGQYASVKGRRDLREDIDVVEGGRRLFFPSEQRRATSSTLKEGR